AAPPTVFLPASRSRRFLATTKNAHHSTPYISSATTRCHLPRQTTFGSFRDDISLQLLEPATAAKQLQASYWRPLPLPPLLVFRLSVPSTCIFSSSPTKTLIYPNADHGGGTVARHGGGAREVSHDGGAVEARHDGGARTAN
ncbi:hypothetical protein V2J09_022940, partial [Rumex salicifolius]